MAGSKPVFLCTLFRFLPWSQGCPLNRGSTVLVWILINSYEYIYYHLVLLIINYWYQYPNDIAIS